MPVVIDANVIIVLVSGDARKPTAETHFRGRIEAGEELHTPALLAYEVANGLTQLVAAGAFPVERVAEAWRTVMELPISYYMLWDQGDQVITIALRLQRRSAYDAAYLALASSSGQSCGPSTPP